MQFVVGLLLALSMDQAAAPAATGRVSGRVTVEGANTPVTGARIMLFPAGRAMGPMGMPPQALTDQDGRFVLDKLAPGDYHVNTQKSGLATLTEPGRAPIAHVVAGQTVQIDVRLQKGGVIAGRLLEASGEPMTEASVMAMRRINANPSGTAPRLIPAPIQGPQQTNDLGEFRIIGLAPGEYVVAATPRGAFGFGGPGVTPSANGTAATTTYYPGTIDQVAAHTVTVAAGQTVDNINFSIQSVPAFQVWGRVVDENGAPVAGAMVMLMGDPRGGASFMGPTGNARTGDDGRFTIAEVPSGTYRMQASVLMMNVAGRGAGGAGGGGSFTSWSSSAVSAGVSGGVVGGVTNAVGGALGGVLGGKK